MKTCVVCKNKGSIKLPKTTLYLCPKCIDDLNFKANDGHVPILSVNINSLYEHDCISKEVRDCLENDKPLTERLAEDMSNIMGSDDFLWELYNGALEQCGERVESIYLSRIKTKDLPLIPMDSLVSSKAKQLLERRLKGE